jgi:trehalose 6-phosphate phosphatase
MEKEGWVEIPDWVSERIRQAEKIYLFLDYDGTLAEFAPTPDHIFVDAGLVRLLERLIKSPRVRIAVVSGRRLEHVRSLLPVDGMLIAGTYGIELVSAAGEKVEREAYSAVRPVLEALKPRWEALIAGHPGFYLEDKGWALAIHARMAEDKLAEKVLAAARQTAEELQAAPAPNTTAFRLLGGHKFQEIGPGVADKGQSVAFILEHYPFPGALPLFLGDDDKDERAFEVIKSRGGLAGVVAAQPRPTLADFRLASPLALRSWIEATFLNSDDPF